MAARAPVVVSWLRWRSGCRRPERQGRHGDQDGATHDPQQPVDADQDLRDGGQAEGRDRTVRGIRRGDTRSGEESVGPAAVDGPPDDQEPDRPQRERDGEADREPPQEDLRVQGAAVGAGVAAGGFGAGVGEEPPVPTSRTPVIVA